MSGAALVLAAIGGIVVLVMSLWLLVKAFQTSVLWGLGYIFVPFVSLIFVAMYWEDTKKPFLYMLAGGVVLLAGVMIGGPPPEMIPS